MNATSRCLPILAGAVFALSACSGGTGQSGEDSQIPRDANSEERDDASSGETANEPMPEWDQASTLEAINIARDATTAFVRTDLDRDAWYSGLEQYLTENAAESYSSADPNDIPADEVTGPGALVDDSSAYVAVVSIPTDAGDYLVTVVREDAEPDWFVEEFEQGE